MSNHRQALTGSRRWVVKLGSSLLTNNGLGLRTDALHNWARQVMDLRKNGCEVVIVSSGAVAEGAVRLGWKHRPQSVHELQAAAAVGQMGLVQAYESCFQKFGVHTAQILLTHEDIADRQRYLNARSSLNTLLKLGVVPIINENDTVATEEIRLGDNDTLAGLVTNLIDGDLLVLLTDQPGLFDQDPREHPGAKLINEAEAGDPALLKFAGKVGALGRGGMQTKLNAATLAAKSGAATVIAAGHEDNVLCRIAAGELIGTLLTSREETLTARKQWLAGRTQIHGRLILDAGAVKVLRHQGKSLLAVGVKSVEGDFRRGEIVSCLDENHSEIARGLVNYGASDARKIMGKPSDQFAQLLGYIDEPELIHRDNLVLV